MKQNTLILIFFYWLILSACRVGQPTASPGNTGGNSKTEAVSNIETPTNTLSLVDYLRREPGIQISGPKNDPIITIRNAVSGGQGETSPLFVIDNRPVGNSYPTVASMIDVNDIKSITILKDVSSTSFYGLQGANGVIIIHTKTGSDKK
jgi:TonB-dependent SusC/RagA subfamily outer membrane receptor